MTEPFYAKPVERLFPFALRSGIVVVGRDALRRLQRKLCFLLVTTDLSETSREQFARDLPGCPMLTRYTSEEIEKHFRFQGTKALGFKKSPLAQSIYRELRDLIANESEAAGTPPAPKPPEAGQAGTDSDMSAV